MPEDGEKQTFIIINQRVDLFKMIVLHGTWKAPIEIQERGDFFLWGESSVPVKRKGRRTPLPHPFQASQDDISKIITSIDFANKGAKKADPGLE